MHNFITDDFGIASASNFNNGVLTTLIGALSEINLDRKSVV